MTAILMDSETGDIYFDENNNTVQVDNERGFQQVLDGLFHCDPSSEPFNTFYGFDLKSALRESSYQDSEMYVESLIVQALNPQIERLISKIEYVQASYESGIMNVVISVSSILNDNITFDFGLGEL